VDWPPDLFALTSLVLQRSGAFRCARTPLEELFTGADWDLCAALLTLHAIADEACAGLGVALAASNPLGCGYRGRAREPAGTCPRRRPRRPGRSPSPTPAGYASY